MVKASELIKKHNERKKQKEEIYKKVFTAIEKKILMASNSGLLYCWYQVPEFFINLPIYNVKSCIKFVKKKLIENGFVVEWFKPNILLISWIP